MPDPARAAHQQMKVAIDVRDMDQPGRTEFPEQSGDIQPGIPLMAGGPGQAARRRA